MRALLASWLLVVFSAHAAPTLQARDLDFDGVADAYYDGVHRQTWMAKATVDWGIPIDLPAAYYELLVAYPQVQADWHLPRLFDTHVDPQGCDYDWSPWAGPYAFCYRDAGPTTSEVSRLAGLYGTELLSPVSWASTDPVSVVLGGQPTGLTAVLGATREVFIADTYANPAPFWFVSDGDVGVALAVPEPGTWGLMLLGLGGVVLSARGRTRHRRRAAA
jgi:hypothetical protein